MAKYTVKLDKVNEVYTKLKLTTDLIIMFRLLRYCY